MRLIPTHYTIRSSFGRSADNDNLKSWFVEGSIDGKDRQESEQSSPEQAELGARVSRVHTEGMQAYKAQAPGQSWRINWYKAAISPMD
jgi:hypothetical protein